MNSNVIKTVCISCLVTDWSSLIGRWDTTGKELFRLSDQTGTEFCLGPVSVL